MKFFQFVLNLLTIEEKPFRLLAELCVLVLLLHYWALTNFARPPKPTAPAPAAVMEFSLMAPPAQQILASRPAVPPTAPSSPVKKHPPSVKKTVLKSAVKKQLPAAVRPAPKAKTTVHVPALPPSAPANYIPPSSPTAQPKPAKPPKDTFTEADYRANYAFNPKPKYPPAARSQGWQGKVLLKVLVSAEGASESVTIHQGSGHLTLDESAVEAVEQWRFIPARRGNTPVASSVIVPILFTLSN